MKKRKKEKERKNLYIYIYMYTHDQYMIFIKVEILNNLLYEEYIAICAIKLIYRVLYALVSGDRKQYYL